MLDHLRGAAGDLKDPRIRRVLGLSVLASLALLVAVAAGGVWAVRSLAVADAAWLETVVEWFGGAVVVVLAIVLFPATVGVAGSLFLDSVVDAVETRCRPGLAAAPGLGVLSGLALALRFAAVIAVANLLALAFVYFVPALNLVVFLALNGYLLAREYFELVAMRRIARKEADALRRRNRGALLWAGLPLAALAAAPVVNLLLPVFAAAYMTRTTHALMDKRRPG